MEFAGTWYGPLQKIPLLRSGKKNANLIVKNRAMIDPACLRTLPQSVSVVCNAALENEHDSISLLDVDRAIQPVVYRIKNFL